MKTYYKLVNQNMQTHNGFQWTIGEWREATGDPKCGLCSSGYLHCYDSPLLAVLHNPIHANIKDPILLEVECEGYMINDNGMKCGFQRMKPIRKIPIPEITTEQKVKYGILCALEVYKEEYFVKWAEEWLSGKDRSSAAAYAAAFATYAAYDADVADVAYAANDAANAAYAANNAANVAASAAYAAANAAANAAYAANNAGIINLVEIAEKAMK